MSFDQAKKKPNLRSFIKAVGGVFTDISKPLHYIPLGLLVIISIFLVILFALSIIALFALAIAALAFFIALAVTVPSDFVMEKIGTVGFAIFACGLLLALAYILNILKKYTIKWFAYLAENARLRIGIDKELGQKESEAGEHTWGKQRRFRASYIPLAAIFIGLILFGSSGIPTRLYTILSSAKPSNIDFATQSYSPDEIREISIHSEHSSVKVELSNTENIDITIEQTDWLKYELDSLEGKITYSERSNGRLPLFELIKLYNNAAGIIISLPQDYAPLLVDIESVGGRIYIDGMPININAVTDTGDINLSTKDTLDTYTIQASTDTGLIKAIEGLETKHGSDNDKTLYYKSPGDKMIILISKKGDISIE